MSKTEPVVDLHSHSTCSDGTLTPEELAHLAKEVGLTALALTDHDTVEGAERFLAAGRKEGLEAICGIEFAAVWEQAHKPEVHIVGLGLDPECPALLERTEFVRNSRVERNRKMAEKLSSIGLHMSYEEVLNNAGGDVITRAHFANVMMEKGYIKKREDAFSRYISPGLPGYVERETLSPKLCIETIKEAGGAAILAHPTLYSLTDEQIDTLCAELTSYGLDGIECFYSTFTPAQSKMMLGLAEKYHLLPSGGSDFHGKNKPDIHLRVGRGNLEISYSVWDALKQRTRLKDR